MGSDGKKQLDREIKVRKAEQAVKETVSKAAAGRAETARQDREVKVRKAEARVKDLVKGTSTARAAAAAEAAPKAGLLARAGAATRGALAAARGRGGMLGLLALGASASMEAGHALDQKIAENRAEAAKNPVKDDVSAGGPRRNADTVRSAAKASSQGAPKSSAAAPKQKPSAPKKGAKAAPKTSAKPGAYPTYSKNSSNAASFRNAFAAARKAGKSEFTWEGRRYNTKVK